MVSYCSLSKDRLLTKQLIETSKCFSFNSPRFLNNNQCVHGLDLWSTRETFPKTDISSRTNIDFDEDIGLYLPRKEKIISEEQRNVSCEKRKKNLLGEDIQSKEELSSSEENQPKSIKMRKSEVRSPVRRIVSEHCSRREPNLKETSSSIDLQSLFKEQLTKFFGRESTNINGQRTAIRIPSVEIKQQNLPRRILPASDPTLIFERYSKVHQLITPSQPTINGKTIDSRQSPLLFRDLTTFGFTITPLDISSSKQFSNSSFHQFSSEDQNPLIVQSVDIPCSTNSIEDEQRTDFLQENFSRSIHFNLTKNSNSIPTINQTTRKSLRPSRSSSKSLIQRRETFQLFPPLISGKRLHISISNQKHS